MEVKIGNGICKRTKETIRFCLVETKFLGEIFKTFIVVYNFFKLKRICSWVDSPYQFISQARAENEQFFNEIIVK